jgi:hypothetical protein
LIGRKQSDQLLNAVAMSLSTLLDVLTMVFGGSVLILVFIIGIFCGLSGLLAISDEHNSTFRTLSRVVACVVFAFGTVLPFRSLPVYTLLVAFWWAAILGRIATAFLYIQAAVCAVISFFFWIPHFYHSDDLLVLKAGDFVIFILVPIAFVLVHLSRGSHSLTGTGKANSGPQIPLRQFLSSLSDWITEFIPKD